MCYENRGRGTDTLVVDGSRRNQIRVGKKKKAEAKALGRRTGNRQRRFEKGTLIDRAEIEGKWTQVLPGG
jgi:hypothetical protein